MKYGWLSSFQSKQCKYFHAFSYNHILQTALTRDLKVPDMSGGYCMVVQFGSAGAATLSSKPVRALFVLRGVFITSYFLHKPLFY